jgi:hypothetical protein
MQSMKASAKKAASRKNSAVKLPVKPVTRVTKGKRPDYDSPEFLMALTNHFYAAKREALGYE